MIPGDEVKLISRPDVYCPACGCAVWVDTPLAMPGTSRAACGNSGCRNHGIVVEITWPAVTGRVVSIPQKKESTDGK